jgi:hypothetical protein
MKRLRIVFFTVLAAFFLFSCVSTPEAPLSSANAVPADSSVQAGETQPADAPPSSADTVPQSDSLVDESDVPAIPPPDTLLYFYPEPDPSFLIPPKQAPSSKAVEPKVPKADKPVAKQPVPDKAPTKVPELEKKPAQDDSAGSSATAEILPGIWESEPSAATLPAEKASAASAIPRLPPSRQTAISAGQTLEIWYPGSGWVFLGDASAQNGLGYENRKLDKNDTLFTFKALKPGNYILDFSRFDVLDDSFIQDSIAVSVTEESNPRVGRIRAPDYRASQAVTSAASATGPAPAAPPVPAGTGRTVTPEGSSASGKGSFFAEEPALVSSAVPTNQVAPTPSALAVPSDPAEALKKAQSSLAAGDPQAALSMLDGFFMTAVSALDEGWYLRGQAYEANGATRDMRKALDAYQTLVSAYPESPRWKAADERIRYIRQFYLKIR